MGKKQYKVKYENGIIKPIENISDIENMAEGVVLFFDLRNDTVINNKKNSKPIWEIAQELGSKIPNEELEKLPNDLSINLDHYLYGSPKVE